ncbi:MAG: hypothetical protein A2Y41_06045 [Spirochaetes bacterium GWB1_36_13]|nr:MAG: hypothetical protein A2Y41_06045 [Spirochaetes bacterium GWB1_36_13]
MKQVFKVFVLIFLLNGVISCKKLILNEFWYLSGDDIELYINLEKKELKLTEKKKLVFEAEIKEYENPEENKIRVSCVIKKIGQKQEYRVKYEGLKDFVLWFELKNDSLKMIFNKFYHKPYYFRKTKNSFDLPHRFLSFYELESFKNSFKDAKKNYNLVFLMNKISKMSDEEVQKEEKRPYRNWMKEKYGIKNSVNQTMTDYLFDMDPSSCWITEDYWGTEFEFFIKDSYGKDLKNASKIIGIYFNTGNLDQKNNYYQYHRAKKIKISFSADYDGSLGTSKANYNYINYSLELPDTIEEKMLVFLKPVKAVSVRLEFEDFYMGTQDAFALYDFALYLDN